MAFSSSRSLFILIATKLNSSGGVLDGDVDNDENPKQLSNHDPDDDKDGKEEDDNDSSVK